VHELIDDRLGESRRRGENRENNRATQGGIGYSHRNNDLKEEVIDSRIADMYKVTFSSLQSPNNTDRNNEVLKQSSPLLSSIHSIIKQQTPIILAKPSSPYKSNHSVNISRADNSEPTAEDSCQLKKISAFPRAKTSLHSVQVLGDKKIRQIETCNHQVLETSLVSQLPTDNFMRKLTTEVQSPKVSLSIGQNLRGLYLKKLSKRQRSEAASPRSQSLAQNSTDVF